MNRSPQIKDVPFHAAFRIKALKHVLRQVYRKRTPAIVPLAVDRARATPLDSTSHFIEPPQAAEDLFDVDLATQGFESDVFAFPRGLFDQRGVDRRRQL